MINPRISADWNMTSRLQHSLVHQVYKKYIPKLAEVVQLTPGLLGLGVLFNCHAYEMYCETYD